MGWLLVIVGLVIAAVGLAWVLAPYIPWLEKLPGDIRAERDGFNFYFPIVTRLLLSILVSLLVWLIRLLRGWRQLGWVFSCRGVSAAGCCSSLWTLRGA